MVHELQTDLVENLNTCMGNYTEFISKLQFLLLFIECSVGSEIKGNIFEFLSDIFINFQNEQGQFILIFQQKQLKMNSV